MLAIGCDRSIPTQAGMLRADEITPGLPRRAWQRLSAGAGAKGQGFYDCALVSHPDPAGAGHPADTQRWWLLVRRHRDSGELAFYRCYSPDMVPLRELVRVAGRRWTVEESFQAGKGLAGLDEHQVRRWTSWAALDPAHPGGDATRTARAPATASAKKTLKHGGNDLRLEYWR